MTWCVMPVLAGPQMTEDAIGDLLAQTVPTKILIVNQGVDDEFRLRLERIAEEYPDRVCVWSHVPPLPSLSATWNRALRFVWESGGTEALVVNNDLRLSPLTLQLLKPTLVYEPALFVSAVGVTEEQFAAFQQKTAFGAQVVALDESHGGPDFSCFLISKTGHEKYPFDEGFIPCYGEDCSTHREYMLGGDGERIFSINLPYHHIGGGSNTLKALPPDQREKLERRIGASREYYARKWGGSINHERFTIPFDPDSAQDGVTNPELQAACMNGSPTA